MMIYNYYIGCIVFCVFFIIGEVLSEKEKFVIESRFVKKGKCCYEVPLYFNARATRFEFEINLNKNFTGFSNFIVPEKCEKRTHEQIDDFSEEKFEILQCFSKIFVNLEYNPLNQFYFYIYDAKKYYNEKIIRKNIIGLTTQYDNNELSLIHQLKQYELIEQLQFAIVHNVTNKSEGVLYYGGMPQDIVSNKNEISFRVYDTSNIFWNSRLHNVYFKGNEFKCDLFLYFSTSYYEIFVSFDYFTYLSNVIFLNEILDKKCAVVFNEGIISILCEEYIKYSIGDIVLNIDKYYFTLKQENLFNCDVNGNKCEFVLKFNSAMKGKEWLIGLVFLDNYDILFDIEEKVISFYGDSSILSDNVKIRTFVNSGKIKKILFLIIIPLCVVAFIPIILNYNHLKENSYL